MIEVIGGKLFQWDTGRVARVIPSNGVTIHEVHFAAYGMKYAYVVETYEKDGAVLCSVPNAILQQDKRILCYEVTRTDTGEMSVSSTPLSLAPRSKPQDYVYTEDELKNYDRLESLTEEKLATLKREFSGTVGNLENLNTTDKSNLVAAINEAAQSGASVQSDWNQNDETAADYVKNRPFYYESLLRVPPQNLGYSRGCYKVSDNVPSGDHSTGASCCVTINGGDKINGVIAGSYDDCYWLDDLIVFVALKDNVVLTEFDNTTFPEKGTYFLSGGGIPIITGFALGKDADPEITWDGNTGYIKKLDEQFIPDVSSLIIKSSTPDSTKKFRITVDDSGTIRATEEGKETRPNEQKEAE